MRTLCTILCIAFAVSTFISATTEINGVNLEHLSPWLLGAAIGALFGAILSKPRLWDNTPTGRLASDINRVDISGLPTPQEIEATLARVRAYLDNADDDPRRPQPPGEISVECFACKVTETYPPGTGNAAAQSAHLNTHPERCLVIGA